jgi:tRNA pseudouridine38/39 synthase
LYNGFTVQNDELSTVEQKIIDALIKARLISDYTKCQWTRCGRTDAGVSGYGQVLGK